MSRATSVINGRVMIQYEGSGVPSQISRWPTTTFPLSPSALSLFLLHFSSFSPPPLIARPLETNGTPAAKLLLLASTPDDSSTVSFHSSFPFRLLSRAEGYLPISCVCLSCFCEVYCSNDASPLLGHRASRSSLLRKIAFRGPSHGRFSRRWLK